MREYGILRLPIYESLGKEESERIDELFLNPDELANQIHNLMSEFKEMESKGKFPEVIFLLDRGAAPLEGVIKTLLPHYCPSRLVPVILHINIGRSTIGKRGVNIPFNGNPNILVSTYKEGLPESNLKHILVLDDYVRSGKTLQYSYVAFKRAFPNVDITTKGVFTKIPRWQGRSDYTGLEEYTNDDYANLALDKLNTEVETKGLHFDSIDDLLRTISDETRWLSFRFYDIKRGLMGTVPFARKINNATLLKEKIDAEIGLLCSNVIQRFPPKK